MRTKLNNVEDIYPLGPLQQLMLPASLLRPEDDMLYDQLLCQLRGPLDAVVFQRAWQEVIQLHPPLRTAFLWEGLDQPLQVVRREVQLPWTAHDWTERSAEQQRSALDEFLRAEHASARPLSRAPLVRLALLRMSDTTYNFVFGYHHLVVDGWSVALVLSHVLEAYRALSRGERPRLEAGRRFRDFIAWVGRQPPDAAAAFWRDELQGRTTPNRLGIQRATRAAGSVYASATLSRAETDALHGFARRLGITPGTLLQGAWAIIVSRLSDHPDVVFGVTVSGRPSELRGIERMVGAFINNLPLRVRIDDGAPVGEALRALQVRHASIQQFAHVSPAQVQQWSGVAGRLPLYESLVVFENYPVSTSLELGGGVAFSVERQPIRTGHPLTVASRPAPAWPLLLAGERRFYTQQDVDHMAAYLREVLLGLTEARRFADVPGPAFTLAAEERVAVAIPGSRDVLSSGPLAERMIAMWATVLGVERVGLDDNFFDLGGRSIQAIQLTSQIAAVLKRPVPPLVLFTHPTPASFLSALEVSNHADPPANHTAPVHEVHTPHRSIERRSLLPLVVSGRYAPVDAAALAYLPDELVWTGAASRDEVILGWCEGGPVVDAILETPLGRTASILLPRFASELYEEREELVRQVVDGLSMARQIGARSVSLTGLLSSAVDYGRAIPATCAGQGLPPITTGHATTAAAVVTAIRAIAARAGRDLGRERAAFLGLGSVGLASLRLMLRILPHPQELVLCDLYDKTDALEAGRLAAHEEAFRGVLRLVGSRGEAPAEVYETTLIVGATSAARVVDVDRLAPGSLIVDDSAPHCFDVLAAFRRLDERGDLLFTEGGVLCAPAPLHETRYLPEVVERAMYSSNLASLLTRNPSHIAGCVLSSLLAVRYAELPPVTGLVDIHQSMMHLRHLDRLGFSAAALHCDNHPLPPTAVARFCQDHCHRAAATPSTE